MADKLNGRFNCKFSNDIYIPNVYHKLFSLVIVFLCFMLPCNGVGTQLGPCVYQYENGDIVDLTTLGFSNNTARWLNLNSVVADDTSKFSYNPCYPFSIDETECQDVAACQQTPAGALNIGFAETATFEENDDTLNLIYLNPTFTTSPLSIMRATKVELICDNALNHDPSLEVTGETSIDIYAMSLSSNCCCRNGCKSSDSHVGLTDSAEAITGITTDPTIGLHTLGTVPGLTGALTITPATHQTAGTLPPTVTLATHHTAGTLPTKQTIVTVKTPPPTITLATHHTAGTVPPKSPKKLSAGSVLCILFVCTSAAYLIVGAIYMKLFVGASGKEVIPNIGFWEDLPNLLVDGFMFVLSPCRKGVGSGAYEDI